MIKHFIFLLSLFMVLATKAQSITLGDQTSLYLGDQTTFFFGGNTSINGSLTNEGTLVSYSDMDLVLNTDIGNIKFVGPADQILEGGTIEVGDFTVDKQGKLILNTDEVNIVGRLNTINGVIEADEDDIILSGSSTNSGAGFIEGKLLGRSSGAPITFPMGVNSSPNYITISNLPSNALISVECKLPDANELYPNEDMVGISDEVEWVLKVTGDSVQAQITVDFSGVDLDNLSNGESIRSNLYSPALVVFSEKDTLFHILDGTLNTDNPSASAGTIVSDESIWITNEGRRLAVALIPVIDAPKFFIPKAFSPNASQEENSIFRPYFSGEMVKEISILVFDSFNKQVYSLDDRGDDLDLSMYGWDGVLNSGLEAPEGVYYYKIRLVSETQEENRTGSFLLVK